MSFNMQIAAYVDEDYNIADMDSAGNVRLFQMSDDGWADTMSVRCSISEAANIHQLQKILKDMVEAIGECSVLVTGSIGGVPNAILEGAGIKMWRSQGNIFGELDYIAQQENNAEMMKDGVSTHPVLLGSSCEAKYRINLKKVLESNPRENSRTVLIPFIKETYFSSLEIICDHPPRWLAKEKYELKIYVESQTLDKDGIKLVITPIELSGGCSSDCSSNGEYHSCSRKGDI